MRVWRKKESFYEEKGAGVFWVCFFFLESRRDKTTVSSPLPSSVTEGNNDLWDFLFEVWYLCLLMRLFPVGGGKTTLCLEVSLMPFKTSTFVAITGVVLSSFLRTESPAQGV